MAPQRSRLEKIPTRNFREIYDRGRKAVGGPFILFYLPGDDALRFAAVASRKIGNAVQRNRAKRLLREAFRTQVGRIAMANGTYVLLARAGIRGRRGPEIAGELEKLLTRLKLRSDDSMRRDGHDH